MVSSPFYHCPKLRTTDNTTAYTSLVWLLRRNAQDGLLDHDPTPGTREHERLELLSVLVRAYDEDHYPMGAAATPQAVVDFLLEQRGMTRAELARYLGGRSRVSEFFAGKRNLSLAQIRKLRKLFNVPADVFLEGTTA